MTTMLRAINSVIPIDIIIIIIITTMRVHPREERRTITITTRLTTDFTWQRRELNWRRRGKD